MARVVMLAVKPQDKNAEGSAARMLVRTKSNLGPDDGGFEYELHQGAMETNPEILASYARWGKAVEGTAREILAVAEADPNKNESPAMSEAKAFLVDLLAAGPVPVKIIKTEAEEAGHSFATIQRAKKALDVQVSKIDMKGGWMWLLPRRHSNSAEDDQQKEMSAFGNFERLRDGSGEGLE